MNSVEQHEKIKKKNTKSDDGKLKSHGDEMPLKAAINSKIHRTRCKTIRTFEPRKD
jgi:recombinational DNA repair protein RecT